MLQKAETPSAAALSWSVRGYSKRASQTTQPKKLSSRASVAAMSSSKNSIGHDGFMQFRQRSVVTSHRLPTGLAKYATDQTVGRPGNYLWGESNRIRVSPIGRSSMVRVAPFRDSDDRAQGPQDELALGGIQD